MENGYAVMERTWSDGDVIQFYLELKPQVVQANPRVRQDIGKVAVMRGPVVYCAEEADNGKLLQDFRMDPHGAIEVDASELFGGIRVVRVEGTRSAADEDAPLYMSVAESKREKAVMTLIPYYLWNNRGEGEMTVWMNSIGG